MTPDQEDLIMRRVMLGVMIGTILVMVGFTLLKQCM